MGKTTSLMALVLICGCGETPEWVGTYSASGTWKLSGPLEGGRTVGEATAELLVDEIASALPAPSFVEDKVRDWLEGSVGDTVKSTVDANVPAELAPGGSLTVLLGQTLAAVKVDSTIVLDGDDDELKGKETVTSIGYTISGTEHRVTAPDLGADSGIEAKWSGKGGKSELSIDPHTVAIRYGKLVALVAQDLLQASELAALEAQLSSALSCKTIVAAVGGGSGLKISVVGWDHTISAQDLESICDKAMDLALDKALGQFELDTHVEVGGTVLWSRSATDDVIELESGSDFGGVVNVVPKAVAPQVDVTFTARGE